MCKLAMTLNFKYVTRSVPYLYRALEFTALLYGITWYERCELQRRFRIRERKETDKNDRGIHCKQIIQSDSPPPRKYKVF